MSSTELTFSIVVPTFNRPAELEGCLESLQGLQYPREKFEVIVVDDGGAEPLDESVRLAGRGLDVHLLRQQNTGPGRARNRGASSASGRYLAFTDDDCRPESTWLLGFEGVFEKYPEVLLGGKTVNYLDNPYSDASQVIMEVVYDFYNPNPDNAKFFASNNIALSADLYREVGGFDTEFFRPASEDRELCDRWSHLGKRLVYAPNARVKHGHNLSFGGFWRQHFSYGRGAFHYHKRRSERGSGQLSDDLGFYNRLPALLRRPLSILPTSRAASVMALLVVWQAANIGGYWFEKLRRDLP